MNIIISKFLEIRKKLYCYFFADRIIASYPNVKAKDNRVNLYDYHPELFNHNRYNDSRWNLGDSLGFVVVSFMLEKRGLSLDTCVKKRKHLNCIGSNVFASFQHATIWGGGVHYFKNYSFLYRFPFSRFDFRAVRGPLSRKVILNYGHKCPEVYGDPAILMPLIFNPQCNKTHELLVIPQFISEVEFRKKHPDLYVISMNTNDYKSVITAIKSSKKALHRHLLK